MYNHCMEGARVLFKCQYIFKDGPFHSQGKTIMWKPPKPKQKMYGYSFKVEDTAQESADTGSFSDRIYECSESEIQGDLFLSIIIMILNFQINR